LLAALAVVAVSRERPVALVAALGVLVVVQELRAKVSLAATAMAAMPLAAAVAQVRLVARALPARVVQAAQARPHQSQGHL
jgi:hypothetical protein